jgi:hypothetical protein
MAQPVLTADAVNSMRHGSPQKQQLHEKWLARGVKVASRGSLSARDRARIICPAYPWRLLIFHGLWKLICRLNANSLPANAERRTAAASRSHRKQPDVSKLVAGGQVDARKRILGYSDRAERRIDVERRSERSLGELGKQFAIRRGDANRNGRGVRPRGARDEELGDIIIYCETNHHGASVT